MEMEALRIHRAISPEMFQGLPWRLGRSRRSSWRGRV